MFISRFNRFFERHGRWAYFLLGLIISLSFVIFVTPGDTFGRRSMLDGNVGSMYGKTLDRDEFLERLQETDVAIFLQRGQLLSQDSQRTDEWIDETLKRMRALREAKRRGLTAVSDAELAETIREMWMFQTNGVFDRERFAQFRDNFLARKGIDGAAFDRVVRDTIAISRLEEQVAADVFVSPAEVRNFYDQINEQFTIQYAAFTADVAADGDPSADEIQAYFETHRQDLRRPDAKRVRAAVLSSQDLMDQADVSDAEISDHFNRLSQSAYKDKTLDQVSEQIRTTLKRNKATTMTRDKANELARNLGPRKDGETPQQLAERFAAACEAMGVTAKDSGPFVNDGAIPNIGQFPVFRPKAYALSETEPLSEVIYDAGRYFLACWLETIPGEAPDELDDVMRKRVQEAILAVEAKQLYAEKVAAYRSELEQSGSAWDLTAVYDEQLALRHDLDDEEKEQLRTAFRDDVRTFVVPNFIPREKKARIAAFRPDAFIDQVSVTQEDIAAYYQQRIAEYSKKEVKAKQIMLQIPPEADETGKQAVADKLSAILADIRTGESFEDMARAHSEDSATREAGGDMGYVEQGSKPTAVDTALFNMAPGEISEVIETPGSYVLLKVDAVRDGRPLQEVTGEIRETLLKNRSEAAAFEAAADFVDKAFEALERLSGQTEPGVAAKAFTETAETAGVSIQESEYFRENGVVVPFGFDRDLSAAAFKLSAENPLSDVVKGSSAVYVACWVTTKEPEVPDIETSEAVLRRMIGTARRVRATKVARERAQAEYVRLSAALAEGRAFSEAVGTGIDFTETEPFSRYRPPAGLPGSREVVEAVRKLATGTLAPSISTPDGAVLAYLVSRVLPTDEQYAEERERFEMQLQWMKRQEAVDRFYSRLEEESNTRLGEAWQPRNREA